MRFTYKVSLKQTGMMDSPEGMQPVFAPAVELPPDSILTYIEDFVIVRTDKEIPDEDDRVAYQKAEAEFLALNLDWEYDIIFDGDIVYFVKLERDDTGIIHDGSTVVGIEVV